MGQTATPDQIASIHRKITVPTYRTNRLFACVLALLTLALVHIPSLNSILSSVTNVGCIKPKHAPIVQLLWCGFVTAISLVEAWVKFRAQFSIRYIALDMGRLVFFAMNTVEIVFACLWYYLLLLNSSGAAVVSTVDWVPVVILVVQVMAMQPVLDRLGIAIVEEAVHGKKMKKRPNPVIHVAYVVMELVKVGALFVAANRKL